MDEAEGRDRKGQGDGERSGRGRGLEWGAKGAGGTLNVVEGTAREDERRTQGQ